MSDTIAALATAPGKSGVAVIRISGRLAKDCILSLCGSLPEPRRATYRTIGSARHGIIDTGLVFWFPGPASFTGEDVAEFQVHGSPAVIEAVLEAIIHESDVRMAEPGEFTRRAHENGKLDLIQVEALSDLIEAETEEQRIVARAVLSGGLGQMIDRWRVLLIEAAALLEATIDFADEEVPVDVMPDVRDRLSAVRSDLAAQIAGSHTRERLRAGFEVAIVGRPNAGKSTLLNALAGRKAALTSDVPGTTRDVIEVRLDLDGIPVTFLDTAGIRISEDAVERLGIDLARERAIAADLRVWLQSEPGEGPDLTMDPDDLVVLGKSDIWDLDGVSGLKGDGISDLLAKVSSVFRCRLRPDVLASRLRHREAMHSAVLAIEAADNLLLEAAGDELVAFEVRRAVSALELLIGRVGVEDMLDEIFSRFCLGK